MSENSESTGSVSRRGAADSGGEREDRQEVLQPDYVWTREEWELWDRSRRFYGFTGERMWDGGIWIVEFE